MRQLKHTLTATSLLTVAAVSVSGCGNNSTTTTRAPTPAAKHSAVGYRLGEACSPGHGSKYMSADLMCTNHHLTKMTGSGMG